jgi:hypothetical protein
MTNISDPQYSIAPLATTRPGYFCTKPFETRHLSTKVKSGFATVEQKSEIVELELLMNAALGDSRVNQVIGKGSKILIRADAYAQAWARQIFEYKGVQCIFVPQDFVLGWIG